MDAMIDVNLRVPIRLMHAIVPAMLYLIELGYIATAFNTRRQHATGNHRPDLRRQGCRRTETDDAVAVSR